MTPGAAAAPVVPACNTCSILEHPAAPATRRRCPPSRMAASGTAPARRLQSVPACPMARPTTFQKASDRSDRQVERDM